MTEKNSFFLFHRRLRKERVKRLVLFFSNKTKHAFHENSKPSYCKYSFSTNIMDQQANVVFRTSLQKQTKPAAFANFTFSRGAIIIIINTVSTYARNRHSFCVVDTVCHIYINRVMIHLNAHSAQ